MLIGDFEWRYAMFGPVPYFSKDGKDFRRTYADVAEDDAERRDRQRAGLAGRAVMPDWLFD